MCVNRSIHPLKVVRNVSRSVPLPLRSIPRHPRARARICRYRAHINHPRQPKKFGRNSVLWQNGQRGYVLWNFRFINVCLDFWGGSVGASSRFHRGVFCKDLCARLPFFRDFSASFLLLYLLRAKITQKHKCEFYLWCCNSYVKRVWREKLFICFANGDILKNVENWKHLHSC